MAKLFKAKNLLRRLRPKLSNRKGQRKFKNMNIMKKMKKRIQDKAIFKQNKLLRGTKICRILPQQDTMLCIRLLERTVLRPQNPKTRRNRNKFRSDLIAPLNRKASPKEKLERSQRNNSKEMNFNKSDIHDI